MSTLVIEKNINIIFLHIPKTAGVSISKWIRKTINDEYYKIYFDHPLLERVYKDVDKKYFVVTTVRNPWARAVSGYQNFLRHYYDNRQLMMKDFVEEVIKINGSLPDLNRWIELLPETISMIGEDWKLTTPQTEWTKPGVDLVIKLENIKNEFSLINDLFRNYEPLGIWNKSDLDLNYKEVLNDKSKKIISSIYESDIDTWKYTF